MGKIPSFRRFLGLSWENTTSQSLVVLGCNHTLVVSWDLRSFRALLKAVQRPENQQQHYKEPWNLVRTINKNQEPLHGT